MNIVRVLVVDDSAYVRKVVKQMLLRSPFIEVVGTARDGVEALEQVAELHPDVVTCDLNMPQMDGLDFVRAQMARRPVPIIIISVAGHAGEAVLAALDAGAIDFVQKPTALATDKLLDIADELVEKVKAAAQAPLSQARTTAEPLPPLLSPPLRKGRVDIVLIGTSTGGPQALKIVIPRLPKDFPVPIGMVLHMPIGYTEPYAAKLNEMSALTVVEAKGEEEVVPGFVFLAPAGRHLTFRRDTDGIVRTMLELRPLDTPHRPSVDVLFRSAAAAFGAAVLGVVMTGMGADGREGSAWIKAGGGQIITEAEETCVVYGMPRSVVEAGLSDEVIAIQGIAEAIMERV
jgi:two-component system, chemotaxis family, protein-glutamate methylesterase/glutaminase